MPEFEVFRERGLRSRDQQLRVTFQTKGAIALNPAAFEALGSPEAVELLYADRDRLVGIRATDPSTSHAYTPRQHKHGRARSIAARAFFSHYGIRVEATRRYSARMLGDVLAVDLDQPLDHQTS